MDNSGFSTAKKAISLIMEFPDVDGSSRRIESHGDIPCRPSLKPDEQMLLLDMQQNLVGLRRYIGAFRWGLLKLLFSARGTLDDWGLRLPMSDREIAERYFRSDKSEVDSMMPFIKKSINRGIMACARYMGYDNTDAWKGIRRAR